MTDPKTRALQERIAELEAELAVARENGFLVLKPAKAVKPAPAKAPASKAKAKR